MSDDLRKAFSGMAAKDSAIRREGLPDPAKVAETGIKTRESLGWMEARLPSRPAPRHDIDDPGIRGASDDQTNAEAQERVNAMRRRFHKRARKGREDFEMARKCRDRGHER
ncbi:hypothetical protein [Palleronia rufa]|uniref:hypothetical protein n=1 Tax=Palleronia rufa TaxID=1530186 RepID=UPI00126831F1|nr:hypothetical protein [Palleronia rufa]